MPAFWFMVLLGRWGGWMSRLMVAPDGGELGPSWVEPFEEVFRQ